MTQPPSTSDALWLTRPWVWGSAIVGSFLVLFMGLWVYEPRREISRAAPGTEAEDLRAETLAIAAELDSLDVLLKDLERNQRNPRPNPASPGPSPRVSLELPSFGINPAIPGADGAVASAAALTLGGESLLLGPGNGGLGGLGSGFVGLDARQGKDSSPPQLRATATGATPAAVGLTAETPALGLSPLSASGVGLEETGFAAQNAQSAGFATPRSLNATTFGASGTGLDSSGLTPLGVAAGLRPDGAAGNGGGAIPGYPAYGVNPGANFGVNPGGLGYGSPNYGNPTYGNPTYGSPNYSGPSYGSPNYGSNNPSNLRSPAPQPLGTAGPVFGTPGSANGAIGGVRVNPQGQLEGLPAAGLGAGSGAAGVGPRSAALPGSIAGQELIQPGLPGTTAPAGTTAGPIAPFSVPRSAPGQPIGNGEINTFANP